ncbi:hypothetical protein GC102_05500 [Paenibacillus sp. LMG 31460]|uniref:Lipoprotein n=1 Tax=Paenibacillus germinis TaxID=2654979 RepID=A0ABX1YWB3_9BACL|nr:hypothetical protein [Paenibacillus germinis]NOU85237.1 hypothetical protein [Paenibacillus germinis]
MKIRQFIIGLSIFALILSGCGQKKTETAGQSFGNVSQTTISSVSPSNSPSPKETPAVSKPAVSETPEAVVPLVTPKPEKEAAASTTAKDNKPTSLPSPKVSEHPASVEEGAAAKAANTAATPVVEPKQLEDPANAKKKPASLSNEINWTQFFDNDKQDKPSEKFWDMSGKTVQIKGFMGEVLSFDKHWFLLIPKPGAECPFDNGDETYWNKIMIVFVPDNVKLRYTSGPLLITGKLDVGVKLDESGYKTMFRLYDASFEKIKE